MTSPLITSAPDALVYLSVFCSFVTIVGALFLIISFLLFPNLKTFTFRMLIWLAIFDLVLATGTIFGPLGLIGEDDAWACQVQAFTIQFSLTGGFIWKAIFGIHLCLISRVDVNISSALSRFRFVLYIFIALVTASSYTAWMFLTRPVGVSGDMWCWIREDYLSQSAQYLYYPVVLGVCICLFVYFYLRRLLKKLIRTPYTNSYESPYTFVRTVKHGLGIFFMILFVWIPAIMDWVCQIFGLQPAYHVITMFVVTGQIMGVLHGILYFIALPVIRREWSTIGRRIDRNPSRLLPANKFNARI